MKNKHIESIRKKLSGNAVEQETKTWEDNKEENSPSKKPIKISKEVIERLDGVYTNADESDGIVYTFASYDDVASLANQLPDQYKEVKDALLRLDKSCNLYMNDFESLKGKGSKYNKIDENGFDSYYITERDVDDWLIFEEFINDPKINKNV